MSHSPGIEFHHQGFLTYEHASGTADAIATSFALHHLPDFWKGVAVQRMAAMLRPGGRMYLYDVVLGEGAGDCPPTDFTARPNRVVTALSLPPERPPLQANSCTGGVGGRPCTRTSPGPPPPTCAKPSPPFPPLLPQPSCCMIPSCLSRRRSVVCDSEGPSGQDGPAMILCPLLVGEVRRVVDAARRHSARKAVVRFLALGHESATSSRIPRASHNVRAKPWHTSSPPGAVGRPHTSSRCSAGVPSHFLSVYFFSIDPQIALPAMSRLAQ